MSPDFLENGHSIGCDCNRGSQPNPSSSKAERDFFLSVFDGLLYYMESLDSPHFSWHGKLGSSSFHLLGQKTEIYHSFRQKLERFFEQEKQFD